MDENLHILMVAYEDEKKALEEIIRQYLSEEELKYAYYHHKALMRVKRNISTLKNIENPFYLSTEIHQKAVETWEKHLRNLESNGYSRDFVIQNLEHHKRELAKLEEELLKSRQVKENTIERAFSELFGQKIKYFKIHLTPKEAFYFKFSFPDKTLQIKMPFINIIRKNYLRNQTVKGLIRLGFTLSKKGTKLKLTLKGDQDQILSEFKVLFSRIVFDVFYVNEFKNQSAIEFGPPV